MFSARARLIVTLAIIAAACDSGPSAPPAAVTLRIAPADTTLVAVGAAVQLKATGYDASGKAVGAGTTAWSSLAASVATVDAGGRVTAVAPGDATIVATNGQLSAQAHVAVRQLAATIALALPQTGPVRAFGAVGRASATVLDATGHPIAGAAVTWTSSDTAVATVTAAGGDVVARRNGVATIVAASDGLSASGVLTVDVRGSIRITVTTTGNARDANGYVLAVDSSSSVVRDTIILLSDLKEGVHPVSLGGVAAHCSVGGTDRQSAVVVPGATAQMAFAVRCLGRFAYPDAWGGVHYVDDVGTDRAITPSYGGGAILRWSPDGSRLLFQAGPFNESHIYVVRPDGTGLMQLTNGPGGEAAPAWSAAGDRIAFTAPGGAAYPNALYVMNADGSNVRKLLTAQFRVDNPRWLKDGRIVVAYTDPSAFGLAYVDAQTGVRQPIAATAGGYHPVVGPDGASIAFEKWIAGVQSVVVLAPGASAAVPISGGSGESSLMPEWFPDGKALLFLSTVAGHFHIFRAGVDGSAVTDLTKISTDDEFPAVSPDGHYILFQSLRNGSGGFSIYAMNADGSDLVQVVGPPSYSPAWRP